MLSLSAFRLLQCRITSMNRLLTLLLLVLHIPCFAQADQSFRFAYIAKSLWIETIGNTPSPHFTELLNNMSPKPAFAVEAAPVQNEENPVFYKQLEQRRAYTLSNGAYVVNDSVIRWSGEPRGSAKQEFRQTAFL